MILLMHMLSVLDLLAENLSFLDGIVNKLLLIL